MVLLQATYWRNDLSVKWHDITWQQNIKLMFGAVTNRRPDKMEIEEKQKHKVMRIPKIPFGRTDAERLKSDRISTTWFVVQFKLC